ncbi:ATP synthase gamma chain [Mesomycoplasma conjunctivae]|uniref:ATP synthase gamma chain n=1 Tax=Mesomycoplasma conjunctivae (strain ATCC 25834 / NCTC 10147 / HRC/581) TaxID=572263 RepID=C5J778_MESCH|nr:ATP synthase F1 subunit gamma [Mesomycoplasma conjunctivae]CAT05341.1 ATP synthase gamma chain [Mesomycoplasma conjunctivae]VEU66567.1 ATP synthase gamma chain [Mesomycoplasma conjunctivae]
MPKLNHLKSRLSQIKNIEKMTKVMEMIANAKIPQIKRQFEKSQQYFENLDYIFQQLIANLEEKDEIFLPSPSQQKLFIIFTSNLGFCGAFNNATIKTLKNDYQKGDKIIVFGKKGRIALDKYASDIIAQYINYEERNFEQPILQVASIISDAIVNKKYSKIKICFTHFINIITSVAQVLDIYPLKKSQEIKTDLAMEFEPDAQQVLTKMLPFYTQALLTKSFIESKLSELSSRRVAMDSATDNAVEIIEKLELELNSSRQTVITQEIIEIIGANLEIS